MRIGESGAKMIAKFEGFSSKPYLCPSGLATIGFGTTRYPNGKKVTLNDKPITREEGIEIFKGTIGQYENAINKNVKSDINQNQFDALISLVYNIGVGNFLKSTLLKKVNINPNDKDIDYQFSRWNRSNGVVLKGLVKRRISEAELYFFPM